MDLPFLEARALASAAAWWWHNMRMWDAHLGEQDAIEILQSLPNCAACGASRTDTAPPSREGTMDASSLKILHTLASSAALPPFLAPPAFFFAARRFLAWRKRSS